MIRSMTGFGKGEFTDNGTSVVVEVFSVNGRFFDLKTRMPKSLNEYEGELRKIVQKYIERGRVTVSIFIDRPGMKAEEMEIDYELADRYLHLAEEISAKHGIENNIDSRTLLSLPEVICWGENGFDSENIREMVQKSLLSALEAHRNMREKEGAVIGDDMSKRLKVICGHIEKIDRLAPEAVEANTVRLRKKIESLIGRDALDETRFAMEVALYADRADITEESVRLRSHCDQFAKELSGKKTSGRKLSFLLQEMNREANTIGSKIMDAAISQTVVRIKEELEKMREQAENME